MIVFVDGVLDNEGAKYCKKMHRDVYAVYGWMCLPDVTGSALRRVGLSFDRPANGDVVLPATNC